MNFGGSRYLETDIVEINCEDRWSIYLRLQELGIDCWCSAYQPLRIKIDNSVALIQLWSVARQVKIPRQDLINWLNHCWHFDDNSY